MNAIKHFLSIVAISLGLGLAMGHAADAGTESSPPGATPTESMADGEIRRIDHETGKVTIRHGEIRHLDMPGMTMVFTARDKGLLAGFKASDKIRFMAVDEGGRMVVTDIQPAR